jgi:hypothetical protein
MKEKKLNGAASSAVNGTQKTQKKMKGKQSSGPLLRAKPVSAKEQARRARIKAYFDSLDEDAKISEFEKLSLDDKHWLAWAFTYEAQQQGRRLT